MSKDINEWQKFIKEFRKEKKEANKLVKDFSSKKIKKESFDNEKKEATNGIN